MKKSRRKFTAAFKTQVTIEGVRERETLVELARRFEVHPNIKQLTYIKSGIETTFKK